MGTGPGSFSAAGHPLLGRDASRAVRPRYAEFTRYYGMLIAGLSTAYINGFAYTRRRRSRTRKSRERAARAREVFAGKLWREQLRDWDETFKPASIAAHREIQAVDPDALSDAELVAYLTRCRDHHAAMISQHMRHTGAAVVPIGDFLAHAGDWTVCRPPNCWA